MTTMLRRVGFITCCVLLLSAAPASAGKDLEDCIKKAMDTFRDSWRAAREARDKAETDAETAYQTDLANSRIAYQKALADALFSFNESRDFANTYLKDGTLTPQEHADYMQLFTAVHQDRVMQAQIDADTREGEAETEKAQAVADAQNAYLDAFNAAFFTAVAAIDDCHHRFGGGPVPKFPGGPKPK